MTTATDLDTIVGNAYNTTPKADAITLAQKYLSTADGDSDGDDLATAMLAASILHNQRQAEKARTDSSIAIKTLDQLITPEIERLLRKDQATIFDIIQYKAPTKHWSEG